MVRTLPRKSCGIILSFRKYRYTTEETPYGIISYFELRNQRMSEKRYYTFGRYLRERFGERVHKIAIDAGFTCPNLDGLKAKGCGAVITRLRYNSRRSSAPSATDRAGIAFMRKRFKARKFMAYFRHSAILMRRCVN